MHFLIFGLGYTGTAIAAGAAARGWRVTATSRDPSRLTPPPGVTLIRFADAGRALVDATHVLQTAAPGTAEGPIPDRGQDPALALFADEIAAAPLAWLGYLSTTGVYGNRDGGWVDEATPPAPSSPRGQRRLDAENAWRRAAAGKPLDLFRVAGIYGPGRSPFDEIRGGRARRVSKPGHLFGRIHRDDIAAAVLAAAARPDGTRVLNLNDDEPATSADVTAEAARLLGLPTPPLIPFDEARRTMSEMGLSFWAENRRVRSVQTQATLGLRWRYPTYREGLAATLAASRAEELGQARPQ